MYCEILFFYESTAYRHHPALDLKSSHVSFKTFWTSSSAAHYKITFEDRREGLDRGRCFTETRVLRKASVWFRAVNTLAFAATVCILATSVRPTPFLCSAHLVQSLLLLQSRGIKHHFTENIVCYIRICKLVLPCNRQLHF